MRKMLARGKSVDGGEWVKGYYCPTAFTRFPCKPSIYPVDTINNHWHAVEIIPETLGWETGLSDRNNEAIFEGDILKRCDTKQTIIYTVDWCDDCAMFVMPCITKSELETDFTVFYGEDFEVIGNIHDNPELIGGEKNVKTDY